MPNLTLNELKQMAKMRCIKGYKNMSEKRLLSTLDESESAKSFDNEGLIETRKDFDNERLNKIRKYFNKLRHRFSKPEIKEIRKNLHEIERKMNLSESKTKKIQNNLSELEKILSRFRKNGTLDYEDVEYRGIRDLEYLFH